MDLGTRQIRTAGKGSGSIELTLPSELRDLVGLPCKVTLRDGSRPGIVLRPDLARVHQAYSNLWRPMADALLPDDPAAFPSTAFAFGLTPRSVGEVLYLCWRDGLALAGHPPYEADAVCRTFAAFGHAMAADLGIDPALAAGFGAMCGTRLSGAAPEPDAQEACDLAALHLPFVRPPFLAAGSVLDPAFWDLAEPVLNTVADLFSTFSADPIHYARLSAVWRRGRTIELDDA